MENSLFRHNQFSVIALCLAIAAPSALLAQDWDGGEQYQIENSGFSGREGGRGFGGRGPGGGFGRGGRGGPGNQEQPAVEQPAAPTQSVMKPHDRVTVDLPENFMAGDLDFDGQIGLYEWRQWRRGDMLGFLALDHNGDGFLTPQELAKGPRAITMPVAPVSITSTQGGSGLPTRGLPAGTQPVSTTVPGVASGGDNSATVTRASSMFGLMDNNRNGSIDPEEWARSSKLKPQFEAAGIDLKQAMTKDEFVRHFLAVDAQKK